MSSGTQQLINRHELQSPVTLGYLLLLLLLPLLLRLFLCSLPCWQ
jgi:hypothetical protein